MAKTNKRTKKIIKRLPKIIEKRKEVQKARNKYKKSVEIKKRRQDNYVKKQKEEEQLKQQEKDELTQEEKLFEQEKTQLLSDLTQFFDNLIYNTNNDENEPNLIPNYFQSNENEEEEISFKDFREEMPKIKKNNEKDEINEKEEKLNFLKREWKKIKKEKPQLVAQLRKKTDLEFFDDDEEEDENEIEMDEEKGEKIVLTKALFDSWSSSALSEKSEKGLKGVIGAFYLICHLNDEDDLKKEIPFRIPKNDNGKKLFHFIFIYSFSNFLNFFNHFLDLTADDFIDQNDENDQENDQENENFFDEENEQENEKPKKNNQKNNGKNNTKNNNEKNEKNNEKNNKNEPKNGKKAKKEKKVKKRRVTSLQFKITSHNNWPKIRSILRNYLMSLIHFLENDDQISDQNILLFVLKNLTNANFIHYFSLFPNLSKLLLKSMTMIWSRSGIEGKLEEENEEIEEENETNNKMKQMSFSFLIIRELSILLPFPFVEYSLKAVYLAYLKSANSTTRKTLKTIEFMEKCVIEICSIDFKTTYNLAYYFIRLLALQLRSSLSPSATVREKEKIYQWSFINALSLWVNVIFTHPDQSEIQLLVYPITQIINGVLETKTSIDYLPAHFRAIDLLLKITQSTQVYIPLSPFLLRTLDERIFKGKNKRTNKVINKVDYHFDWRCNLKIDRNNFIYSKNIKNDIVKKISEFLLVHFNFHSFSIAFPEIVLPTILFLKKFLKGSQQNNLQKNNHQKNNQQNNSLLVDINFKPLRLLLDALENNSNFISTHRRKVCDFGPKDFEKIDSFLSLQKSQSNSPLSKFFNQQEKIKATVEEGPFIYPPIDFNALKLQNKIDNEEEDDEDEDDESDDEIEVENEENDEMEEDDDEIDSDEDNDV